MKKIHKIYDVKDFELKLLLMLVTGSVVTASFKINDNLTADSDGEINIIKDETIEEEEFTPGTFKEATRNSSEYECYEIEPISDEYYKSYVIQGRIFSVVKHEDEDPEPNYEYINAYTDEQILGEDGIIPEGYNEYLERKEHDLNFSTTDEMISFYSKVFELNEDITSKIIYEILGNNEYQLEGEVEINGTTYRSLEAGIALIIFDISNNPDYYGFSEDEIRSTAGFQLDYHLPEEFIYKFGMVIGVDPRIAAAILYEECGYQVNSDLFIYNNNYGGIVKNGRFASYMNKAAGAFEFIYLLGTKYYVGPEESVDRIYRMKSYCEGEEWAPATASNFITLQNNGFGYIYYTYRYQGRDLIYSDENVDSFYRSRYYNGN